MRIRFLQALIIFLVLGFTTAAPASFIKRCQALLESDSRNTTTAWDVLVRGIYLVKDTSGQPTVYWHGIPYFLSNDIERWRSAFTSLEHKTEYSHPAIYYDLFWHLVSELPPDILADLKHFPESKDEAVAILEILASLLPKRSFLDDVRMRVRQDYSGPSWFALNLTRYAALSEEKRREYQTLAERIRRMRRAEFFWKGDLPISISSLVLGVLGNRQYQVIRKNERSIVVLVPRSYLWHPAWNPVSFRHVLELAAIQEPPPEIYRADISIDGRLFLEDGNHRFQLDSRSMIPVELIWPASINIYRSLDALGFTQPSIDTIIELFEGRNTLRYLRSLLRGNYLLPEVETYLNTRELPPLRF